MASDEGEMSHMGTAIGFPVGAATAAHWSVRDVREAERARRRVLSKVFLCRLVSRITEGECYFGSGRVPPPPQLIPTAAGLNEG